MKEIRASWLMGIAFFFNSGFLYSQSLGETYTSTSLPAYPLAITFNKTTHLIFPYTIKSVDRGSPDILAPKATGVENVLLVKAGQENFPETNLSIITSDGKFYSFLVHYNRNPAVLTYSFAPDLCSPSSVSLLLTEANEADVKKQAEQVAPQKRMFSAIRDRKYKMQLQLNGLFILKEVFFYQIEIQNKSRIDYTPDQLRFFIRDEKKMKRTASQEIEVQPLYVYGDTSSVKGLSHQVLVCVLPKFTIPDKKHLVIQLMEKNGGRHLQLKVRNSTLVRARVLTT